MAMDINLVCPKCAKQNVRDIAASESYHRMSCPTCNTSFSTWIVRVRAKNSRQDKRANSRNYSVRIVEFGGRESLIEFHQSGISDFELRSGDLASFSYLDNVLVIVQNLTVN